MGQRATKHEPPLIRDGWKKAAKGAVRDKGEAVAMLRNHGERCLGPQKELEGAGGGRQRRKQIVATPTE